MKEGKKMAPHWAEFFLTFISEYDTNWKLKQFQNII